MQLNLTTDYAIRSILYLSHVKQETAQELSNNLNISSQYITYMMSQTNISQYIQPIIGVKGGYRLRKAPDTMNLLDIIKVMEKTIKISHCLEDDNQCSTCNTFENHTCPIKKVYEHIQDKLESRLAGITFRELSGD